MAVEVTTLANGMRVVTDAALHLESASVGVWVDVGARYETAEINGVAHLLEHMAFKGTKRRDARAIVTEIEAVGGHLNAYTGREHTAYYARVLKHDVPLAVDILGDILQYSVFDPAELERERHVVLQEIGQAEDTPDDIIFDHLQAASYPDQPMGWSILGTDATVAEMSREALAGFMGRHYRAERMVLVAAGAIEHEAIVRLAQDTFGGLQPAAANGYQPATYVGGEIRLERDLEQVHIALALPGVAYEDPDFYACQVLSTVAGGGMSSRLFQELREVRGLCYSVFTFASSYVDGGSFGLYAGTGEDQVAELVPVACDELARLAADADEDEVARARAQLKAGMLMSLESSTARSEQLARQVLIYGRPLSIAEIVAKVDAVDAAAVRRVTARLLAGTPSLAALGPVERLASFDDIAAKFAGSGG